MHRIVLTAMMTGTPDESTSRQKIYGIPNISELNQYIGQEPTRNIE